MLLELGLTRRCHTTFLLHGFVTMVEHGLAVMVDTSLWKIYTIQTVES